MPAFIDLRGQRFGRWTVLRYLGRYKWACHCDCGRERDVTAQTLRNGSSLSCGCLRTEVTRQRVTSHGRARKGRVCTEWNTWSGMKQRCYNPRSDDFPRYGGRGITVCDRWRASFSAFYEDMGPRPIGGTLNRVDNDGPYSPDNCQWATRLQQARNTRQNRLIVFNDLTLTLAEWGERTGIDSETISYRLKHGWTIERALRTPVHH